MLVLSLDYAVGALIVCLSNYRSCASGRHAGGWCTILVFYRHGARCWSGNRLQYIPHPRRGTLLYALKSVYEGESRKRTARENPALCSRSKLLCIICR